MTKKITLAALRRQLRDRERRFLAMTPENQRITIAKDVIEALNLRTIVPSHNWAAYPAKDRDKDLELAEVFATEPCTACALGGMFVCAVKRADKLTVGDVKTDFIDSWSGDTDRELVKFSQIKGYLRQWFELSQLRLIEMAYERGRGTYRLREWLESGRRSPKNQQAAVAFGSQFDDDAQRMVAIMKNVIENKGMFVP